MIKVQYTMPGGKMMEVEAPRRFEIMKRYRLKGPLSHDEYKTLIVDSVVPLEATHYRIIEQDQEVSS